MYGALAEDGTRLMRQYEKFDGPTFVEYLEEVRRKWDKAFPIMDNANQHKIKVVREYLEGHKVQTRHSRTLRRCKSWRMQRPNTLERAQSGSASTNSCTAACEAKFSMISTIGRIGHNVR